MTMSRRNLSLFRRVPAIVWFLTAALLFAGPFSSNPSLTGASAILLLWFFMLLWRPGEPPILLLALGFQWLQVVTKVINADLLGLPVSGLNPYQGNIDGAIWLSLLSLAVMALGMRFALARYKAAQTEMAFSEAMLFSPNRLWVFYLVSVMLGVAILLMARVLPEITQLALALANIKWVAYFMLAYVCFLQPERMYLLLMAFGIEFVLGLGAYFSSFKMVFFVTILAFVASGKKLSGKQIAVVLSLTSVLFALSLVWTAVKTDYRNYLSGGQRAQIITRGYVERIQKLYDMVSELEKKDMANALQNMADRISYVDFFGRTLVIVPGRIPHEGGELWAGAIRHIFMPRLFFPDKPPLRSDSEITNYYTGLGFGGEAEGTSVSIGYVAESYIDFGGFWMFAPVLALGFLWGAMYRYFLSRPRMPAIIGYGLAVVVLLGALHFETTNVKLLGGVVTSFIVAFVVQKFFVKKLVRKLMVKRRRQSNKTPFVSRQV